MLLKHALPLDPAMLDIPRLAVAVSAPCIVRKERSSEYMQRLSAAQTGCFVCALIIYGQIVGR